MTNREKAELLEDTIRFLFEKEGRSKSYISRLLNIDRRVVSIFMNEKKMVKANIYYMKPSTKKFLNKNKNYIISQINKDVPLTEIAKVLKISEGQMLYFSNVDKDIYEAKIKATERVHQKHAKEVERSMRNSRLNYNFEEFEGEEWKEILGYPDYFVSNFGRVKHYIKRYDKYILLTLACNPRSGRYYVSVKKKYLSVSRLVGHAFVEGFNEINNTIDHIDGDYTNNKSSNLRWVSQKENNKNAYVNGRRVNRAFERRQKGTIFIVDGKYEFKTVVALAKFLSVSETQARRYLDKECKCKNHTIEEILPNKTSNNCND